LGLPKSAAEFLTRTREKHASVGDNKMNTNLWIRSMAVTVALVGALLPASGVFGQTTGEIAIPVVGPDEPIFGFEGAIVSIDPATRIINVMGADILIPDALVIEGTTGVTGANLNQLLDENAPNRVRSIYAGTSDLGTPYSAATFKGECVRRDGRLVCYTVVIEMAENVIGGVLENVDVEAKTFSVNGVACVMNLDERFGSEVLGAGLVPITFEDLAIGEGIAAVVCIGYFHEGVLHVVTIEAEELLPPPPAGAVDSVVIAQTRGRDRARGAELRVQVVTTFEVGKTITLYDDLGSILGIEQVLLDPLTGGGEAGFRLRNLERLPNTVRAVSSGGGEHTVEVEVR
jgi:hypothetical protein